MSLGRRALLAAPLAVAGALAACERGAQAASSGSGSGVSLEAPTAAPLDPAGPVPGLRELAPFPIGTEVVTAHLDDPALPPLAARHFSQITPGYELKMEVVLKPDFRLDFTRADRIADWAKSNGQRFYATTLIWYAQDPDAFKALDGDRAAFGRAYDKYIADVMGRYRGRAVGWDCVNEPVSEDGTQLRPCRWATNLGQEDYMLRAFEQAHAVDPDTVLFLNEYGLERLPGKRLVFMRLVERLLKRGAPIGGLGDQSHLDIDVPDGVSRAAMKDLASFGLPIHSSELDCSTVPRRLDLRTSPERLRLQARRFAEVLDAFLELPPRQRFAFTLWGVRDSDSWLNLPNEHDGKDAPLAFDAAGAPKPAFWALAQRLRG